MKEYVITGDDKKKHIVVINLLDGEPIVVAQDVVKLCGYVSVKSAVKNIRVRYGYSGEVLSYLHSNTPMVWWTVKTLRWLLRNPTKPLINNKASVGNIARLIVLMDSLRDKSKLEPVVVDPSTKAKLLRCERVDISKFTLYFNNADVRTVSGTWVSSYKGCCAIDGKEHADGEWVTVHIKTKGYGRYAVWEGNIK